MPDLSLKPLSSQLQRLEWCICVLGLPGFGGVALDDQGVRPVVRRQTRFQFELCHELSGLRQLLPHIRRKSGAAGKARLEAVSQKVTGKQFSLCCE